MNRRSALRTAAERALRRLGLWRLALAARQAAGGSGPLGLLRNARRRRRGAGDGLPLPGPLLMAAVAGTADAEWFLAGGRRAAESIAACLERQGIALAALGAILDFGCGCGRVLRCWAALDGPEIWGTDADRRAVRWCRRHLPFARCEHNRLAPPLPFAAGRFDLVYALSVFTHLPEDLGRRWSAELARVLAPGGHLLLTTHGDAYLPDLTAEERRTLDHRGIAVRAAEAAGSNRCSAYHAADYVRTTLAGGLAVVEHLPEGAAGNPRQDLFLLRKPQRAHQRSSTSSVQKPGPMASSMP